MSYDKIIFYFYLFLIFFPLLSITICVFLFYYNKHYKNYNFFPTISEMNVDSPEKNIFSISMLITAISFIIYGITRYYYLKKIIDKKNILKNYIFLYTLILIGSFNMIIFGFSPVKYHRNLHNISAGFFFTFICLFYLFEDIIRFKFNDLNLSIYSWIVTISSIIFIILHVSIRNIGGFNKIKFSISSVCEIISIALLMVKIGVIMYENKNKNNKYLINSVEDKLI